jgi:nucleoid-associated protein YgaU
VVAGSALAFTALLSCAAASLVRAAWADVLGPGPASADQALAALAGSAATAILFWLTGALALSLLSALVSGSGRAGRLLAGAASSVAPLVVRNGVAALLGVAIAAGPGVAVASAAPLSVRPVITSAFSDQAPTDGRGTAETDLSPSWLPSSPAAKGTAGKRAGGTTRNPLRNDLSPAFAPAGPAQAPATSKPSSPSAASNLVPGWFPTLASPPKPSARVRTVPPTRSPRPNTPATPGPGPGETVVHRGDTLWSIASRQLGPAATDAEIAADWPHWFDTNREVIGRDPDRVRPGMRLRSPGAAIAGARAARQATRGPATPAGDQEPLP